MNNSNYTSSEDTMPLDIVLIGTFFYCMISIIGVIGNILVISVLMIEKDLRNFTNYLLANLSISDLMVLLTCVPTGLHGKFDNLRLNEFCFNIVIFLKTYLLKSAGI